MDVIWKDSERGSSSAVEGAGAESRRMKGWRLSVDVPLENKWLAPVRTPPPASLLRPRYGGRDNAGLPGRHKLPWNIYTNSRAPRHQSNHAHVGWLSRKTTLGNFFRFPDLEKQSARELIRRAWRDGRISRPSWLLPGGTEDPMFENRHVRNADLTCTRSSQPCPQTLAYRQVHYC